jgi:predicted nucleotidyltransferase
MLNIESNIVKLKNLCADYHVDKMYLFGSALNSSFTAQSDVDLLVKFKQMDLGKYFQNYMELKKNLESLLGRKIDLLEEQTLKNPILIKSINKSKELIYGREN